MSETVVIDVGCATYGGDESIATLVDEYAPVFLLGLDPNTKESEYQLGETRVHERPFAAWTKNGPLRYTRSGLGGWVGGGARPGAVQIVGLDLAKTIRDLRAEYPSADLMLKLDCEGSEYELVPHLIATGAATELREILVEWHCEACRHGLISPDAIPEHPAGCPADPAEWANRRAKYELTLREVPDLIVGRWNK